MNRPVIGPLNPTRVDHATDAYDTIDWLVHHVPETNGRVGTIGTSHDGFTVLMSLIHPHPALKAAVPNIFFAKPSDYVKATERVFHAPDAASCIQLPVVPASDGTVVAGE